MATKNLKSDNGGAINDHLELVSDDHTICGHCGNEYNYREVEVPDNPSFYWVPSCPECGAKMTCNPPTQFLINLIGKCIEECGDDNEYDLGSLQSKARLYHGRLVGYSTDELVKRAQWFDRKAKSGKAYGPRFYRDIAFALRKQARGVS